MRQVVPPLGPRFAANVVVIQLGLHTHYRDPLANLTLNTAAGIYPL
ncbi:MAG: hypothetical protein PVH65_17690 [Chloroflexota bacterium]|jgi:acetoin utilization deacetylase AcuC-like enzyme